MIRHLRHQDFTPMPWANGKGVTLELARFDHAGAMQWRLSRASVVEEGDFSNFPAIDRNLTVITGPGFTLSGPFGLLPAAPFEPVAFPGDVPVRAIHVTAPSDDFNVMTARHLAKPFVRRTTAGAETLQGRMTALYALATTQIGAAVLETGDLLLTDEALRMAFGDAMLVRFG